MKNKKIIFVATRFPYPSSSGREKTLLEYLEFIKNEYEVYFYYFDKMEADKDKTDKFKDLFDISEVNFIQTPNIKKSFFYIVYTSFILGKKSIQESIFWNQNIQNFFQNEILRIKPNVIFTDMIRTAQYFEDSNIFKIFDMDDVISKRYEYLLNHKESNILGYFSDKLPKLLNLIINTILRKLILSTESKLVKKREVELVEKYDKTLLVSPIERKYFVEEFQSFEDKVFAILPSGNIVLNNIVNVEKIDYSISFMGLLNVPHNEKGLIYFLENIFPILKHQIPSIHLYIIGKNATIKLQKLCDSHSNNITLTGFLENPTELILKTQLLIAPVYFGTGIKIKILESMSIGIPIITTPIGAEGLMVEDKKNILISKNDNEFITNILIIFNDKIFRDRIGNNGREYIHIYHNPSQLKKQFLNLMENI